MIVERRRRLAYFMLFGIAAEVCSRVNKMNPFVTRENKKELFD
jgi:hypothetical protein